MTTPTQTEPMVHIMMVDDNPANLLSMCALLQGLDVEIDTATSGKKALRMMLDRDYAFVLLDVNMPNMDGFEVAALMKKVERVRDVPIIFLTAMHKDDVDFHRGYDVGAVDYISTPIDPHILRGKVAAFVELHKLSEKTKRHAEELARLNRKLEKEVARHKLAKLALQEGEARLQAILDNTSAVIWLKDKTGHYTFTNRAYQAMLHRSREEMHGLTDYDLFETCVADTSRINDEKVLITGEAMTVEEVIEHDDGPRIYLAVRFPLKEQNGNTYALCSVNTDITEQKGFEKALSEKNHELQRASLAKDRFLATMSHELRTPLNAIIGFTGTLLMKLPGPLNQCQEQQLATVQCSAQHLLTLINDILDVAKVESGKIEVKPELLVYQTVVEEVAATLKPLAENKGLNFSIKMPKSSVRVETDRRILSQILINLTNNAIKFTKTGEVKIELGTRPSNGHTLATVDVIDTGVGIRSEDKEKLFQAFQQVNVDHHTEGTGLGLYLSQKLAALIQGRIELESEFGKGSVFRLLIPRN